MGGGDPDVVEVGRVTPNPPASAAAATAGATATSAETEKKDKDKDGEEESPEELAERLNRAIEQGTMDRETADAQLMEKTGKKLQNKRTTSNTSWSEEVEMARELAVPDMVSQETASTVDDDDDDDHAWLKLQEGGDAQTDDRAAGSVKGAGV